MSKIISIATSVPAYRHGQKDILTFMQRVYAMNETDKRKLKYLYNQSGIESRYSVLPDYSSNADNWQFYPASENLEPFPNLEMRMKWFNNSAPALSVDAIKKCMDKKISKNEITHLITISCTGMSAPGLDLQVMEEMDLPSSIFRTSINFMGCYAAIHGLKLAEAFCANDRNAKVMVVCTELCTLHFQKESSINNVASGLLFGDGAAAVLIAHDEDPEEGLRIKKFYSEVSFKGKKDMSWELSSSGFLMNLSGYVPELIEQDFNQLLGNALVHANLKKEEISHWCIHPGGKRILSAVEKSIDISAKDMVHSYNVLKNYGNMSSPTVLFVLKEIMDSIEKNNDQRTNIFGAAFGPGLTLETFILSDD